MHLFMSCRSCWSILDAKTQNEIQDTIKMRFDELAGDTERRVPLHIKEEILWQRFS